jgi:hypothetical protein
MRKTLDMADFMHDWYASKAKKLNIPTSALMIMALNEYMKQENAFITMSDVMNEVKKVDSKQGI